MGRKKQEAPAVGHNSESELARKALFIMNRDDYNVALAAKKAADAEIKRVGKQIKADLGPNGLLQIKTFLAAQTDSGKSEERAKVEAVRQALAWAGVPVNTQFELFEVDRIDGIEKASIAGEEAGMECKTLVNPYNEGSPEGVAYAEAWRRGQDAVFAIRKLRLKDEAAALLKSDDPFPDDQREAAE